MCLAALAIAGVMILTTEKLDVVVVLVEVEIEVAAALRVFQQARESSAIFNLLRHGIKKDQSADWPSEENLRLIYMETLPIVSLGRTPFDLY